MNSQPNDARAPTGRRILAGILAWLVLLVMLALLVLIALRLAHARNVVTNTYYNQVNYWWNSGCGCWTDAAGRHLPAGMPAIVNGNVHGLPPADTDHPLHRAAPSIFAEPPAPVANQPSIPEATGRLTPLINNGDYWLSVPIIVKHCTNDRPPADCPAEAVTVAPPPPVPVPEPSGAWLWLLGLPVIAWSVRRARR